MNCSTETLPMSNAMKHHLQKNPDDIPVPPDRQPVPPVQDPRTLPGRDVPEPPPIDNPKPPRPKRIARY